MPPINKRILRLAGALHSDLASHHGHERLGELPKWTWDSCTELVRQIGRAELRGWRLAAAQLRRDLAHTIPSLETQLTAIVSQLTPVASTIASVGDVYEDLLALQADFDEMDYDIRTKRLSMTTEPITLEGIYLGPFEVQLSWARVGRDSAYRVIAQEPHPPECRENVTHPHVMDEILCEGHSRQAIRQALAQGRLLDFFTLVANGLRTYNEESPFVALEIWYGVSCSDCGALVDDDDRFVCQKCEETICPSCETTCCGCDDSCCSQCITSCEACDDNFCRNCVKVCRECRRNICPNCLEEDERCSTCHEQEQRNQVPAAHGIAVHPVCLGQAAVPA